MRSCASSSPSPARASRSRRIWSRWSSSCAPVASASVEETMPPRLPALISDPAPAERRLWLANARLVDGTGAEARERVSVLVEAGRIVRLADADDVQPEGVRALDLGGRTLMPGLIDAHAHVGVLVSQAGTRGRRRAAARRNRRSRTRCRATRGPADGDHDDARRRLDRRPRGRGPAGDAVRRLPRPARCSPVAGSSRRPARAAGSSRGCTGRRTAPTTCAAR